MKLSPLVVLSLCAVAAAQEAKISLPPAVQPDWKATLPSPDPTAGHRPATVASEGLSEKANASLARRAAARLEAMAPRVVFDAMGERIWVAAPSYKARFEAGSWQFFGRPAAGAQRHSPLQFLLESVQVGQHMLPLEAMPAVQRGTRVVLPHGPVVETVDIAIDHVEQSFVIDELPAREELRLVVRTTTELLGEDRGDGITFTNQYLRVDYSEAVAIDANGRRVTAPTTYADGAITIRVPAEFVASARLPIVIDPVVATAGIYAATESYTEPDAAWDETNAVWAVCYQNDFSPFDSDVYLQRFDADLNPVGTSLAVDASADSWQFPRIANNNLGNNFLVVAQVSTDSASPFWVAGRLMSGAGLLQAPFDIARAGVAGHASGDKVFPDVGGDSALIGPTYFTVVWERVWSSADHDIHMKQVTIAGALKSAAPVFVDNSSQFDANPAISNSCGGLPFATQRFGVAWQRTVGAGNRDVYGALLDWDGALVPGATQIALATGLTDQVDAAVSSPTLGTAEPRQLLFVWQDATLASGDIKMSLVDIGGQVVDTQNLSLLQDSLVPASYPQSHPAVETDGVRFVVAYNEGYLGSFTDLDSYQALVAPVSGALVVQDQPHYMVASQFVAQPPRMTSRYAAAGTFSNDCLSVGSDVEPTRELVWLHKIGAYAGGWQVRPRPAGCGGSLTAFAAGGSALGDTFTLSLSSTSGIVGFLAGDYIPATVLPPCPGCSIIVNNPIVLLGPVLMVAVPLTPSLVGAELGIQGFEWGPGTCLGGLDLSNGFQVTVR